MQATNGLSLQESEIRYRRLFEAAQDGILMLDAETGAITDVNPYLMKMVGYSREEMIEKKLWEIGTIKNINASKEAFQVLLKDEYIRYKGMPLREKGGKLIQVEFVSNVYLVGGEKVVQCHIRDITERVHAENVLIKSEASLREESVRDHLTGLFNRRYMEETLEREVLRAARKQLSLSVIMVDVDDFKQFNDTHGHAAGDAVLRKMGNLLKRNVRGEDIACRYGGDEFIIVLPDSIREVTIGRAELLCESAKKFHLKYEGHFLKAVTLSQGVAVFPGDGATSKAILRAVDAALYRAKRKGGGRVVAAN